MKPTFCVVSPVSLFASWYF